MNDDQAKQRFFILVALRLGGVALALLGIAVIMRRLVEPAELIGSVLILVGTIDVAVLPLILARAWRSK